MTGYVILQLHYTLIRVNNGGGKHSIVSLESKVDVGSIK